MAPATAVRASMASPRKALITWRASQNEPKAEMGWASEPGWAQERIIKNRARGATKEPRTLTLARAWTTRKPATRDQAKSPRVCFRVMAGMCPKADQAAISPAVCRASPATMSQAETRAATSRWRHR